ncbi:MAG: hypothetical protein GXO85_12370 [Chlorobi bacterium]|nr:hypothetical protein [Chlorobiota bacterium]
MNGIAVVVIILVPIAYQVFLLQIKMNKRHKEVVDMLNRIEEKLNR